jgi:tetratricopeptide (TPR) repeat protein
MTPRKDHDGARGLRVAGLVVTVALFGGWINPFRERVHEGNEKYKEGKYEESLKIYADAAATFDPESRELHFNIGDSWYKQKDYVKAIEEFSRSIGSEDPLLEAKAHYNIGNASFEQSDYAGAIEEYVRSLKLNSKDEDAKYNLEVARKKLKEQLDKMKDQAQSQQQQEQPKGQDQQSEEQENKDKEQQDQKTPEEQQGQDQPQPQEMQLTKEEAERLLDRLQEDEQEQRREQVRRPKGGSYTVEKDW